MGVYPNLRDYLITDMRAARSFLERKHRSSVYYFVPFLRSVCVVSRGRSLSWASSPLPHWAARTSELCSVGPSEGVFGDVS